MLEMTVNQIMDLIAKKEDKYLYNNIDDTDPYIFYDHDRLESYFCYDDKTHIKLTKIYPLLDGKKHLTVAVDELPKQIVLYIWYRHGTRVEIVRKEVFFNRIFELADSVRMSLMQCYGVTDEIQTIKLKDR